MKAIPAPGSAGHTIKGLDWDAGAIGTAVWGGVKLRDVLQAAGALCLWVLVVGRREDRVWLSWLVRVMSDGGRGMGGHKEARRVVTTHCHSLLE